MPPPSKKAPAKKVPARKPTVTTKPRARRPRAPVVVEPVFDARVAERPVRFFERHLRHTKAEWRGRPLLLERWQKDEILRPIFGTLDGRTGLRWYKEALVGLPRKNSKSIMSAGMMLYCLIADGEPGAEVYSVAGDKKQARLVFDDAKRMVNASPLLRAACKVYRDVIEVRETDSVYRVLSSDADLQHGLNPHAACVDEYHVHKNPEQYEALQSGMGARRQPLLVVITTAGADSVKSPAHALMVDGLAGRDPRMFTRWWTAPEGCKVTDLRAARLANPASWVTDEFLMRQARKLPEPVYRRLHLNQWVDVDERWIDPDYWYACDGEPSIDPDLPCYIGVDAAPKKDTTAVVLVQIDAAGVHHVVCWIFKADRTMGYLDFEVVEDLLREVTRTYNVARIVVDPFAMIRTMMMLAKEGLPVEDFPQTDTRMVPASQNLYDLITEERIHHGGHDDLTFQVLNAGIYETPRGWRFHKLKSRHPIDACTALAMASYVAEQDANRADGPRVLVV